MSTLHHVISIPDNLIVKSKKKKNLWGKTAREKIKIGKYDKMGYKIGMRQRKWTKLNDLDSGAYGAKRNKVKKNLGKRVSHSEVAARVLASVFGGHQNLLSPSFCHFRQPTPKVRPLVGLGQGGGCCDPRLQLGVAFAIGQASWSLAGWPIWGPRKDAIPDWSVLADSCGPRSSKEPKNVPRDPPWFWEHERLV